MKVDKFFKLTENRTNVRTEVIDLDDDEDDDDENDDD